MTPISFSADTAADALAQIHQKLGPDAVVVSVRKRPANGLARLFQRNAGIEVQAIVPTADVSPPAIDPLFEAVKGHGSGSYNQFAGEEGIEKTESWSQDGDFFKRAHSRGTEPRIERAWRSIGVLESLGLLPLYAERLLDVLHANHGEEPPDSLAEEMALTRAALARFWRGLPPEPTNARCHHVFVGPPGVGKTTVLCKWLTQSVLLEGKTARVWRLDGANANTAEALSVYGDILGVPVERFWNPVKKEEPGNITACRWGERPRKPIQEDPHSASGRARPTSALQDGSETSGDDDPDLLFIDLPGVDAQDAIAVQELRDRIRSFPSPKVHLVLNSAYEISTLMSQVRAFSLLPINDLIFSHVDEEVRWAKLWNFVLGTKYSVSFLTGGQNIPGMFLTASAELLLPPQFR